VLNYLPVDCSGRGIDSFGVKLTARPEKSLPLKKPAVGLFHNSSEESEAPGTKINNLIFRVAN
jgi:hypothetical protein